MSFDDLVGDELGDALDEVGLVDLVGDLRDDDGLLAVAGLFDGDLAADHEAAATGAVGIRDAAGAVENAAGGEVRTFDVLEDVFEGAVGLVDDHDGRVDDLSEVVRRDVGCHADGDARAAVHDQVGIACGQDGGLEGALVVVRGEVDGVHVDVGEHVAGDLLKAGFGVTHGGWRVAVDGAEVALAVDERVAHAEGLGEADHGVVDGGVAVGVIVAHGEADDLGALGVFLVGLETHLLHGVEDAAVDGLEAVADVGQGAADDDGHGVVQVGPSHLLFKVDGIEVQGSRTGGAGRWNGTIAGAEFGRGGGVVSAFGNGVVGA